MLRIINIFVIAVMIVLPLSSHAAPASTIGRILLQVEANGEAWYIYPDTEERTYLPNGTAAYSALREFGLGITNADLAKIPVGIEERFEDTDSDGDGLADQLEQGLGTDWILPDSDGDGYLDGEEVLGNYNPLGDGMMPIDTSFAEGLAGKILLQVESLGEAWYVNPVDGKRYYMKDGDAAYQIMRYLSLGITNTNLETIPISDTVIDCFDDFNCFVAAVDGTQPSTVDWTSTIDYAGLLITSTQNITIEGPDTNATYSYDNITESQNIAFSDEYIDNALNQGKTLEEIEADETTANEAAQGVAGAEMICHYTDQAQMVLVLENWQVGNITSNDLDFTDCETINPSN